MSQLLAGWADSRPAEQPPEIAQRAPGRDGSPGTSILLCRQIWNLGHGCCSWDWREGGRAWLIMVGGWVFRGNEGPPTLAQSPIPGVEWGESQDKSSEIRRVEVDPGAPRATEARL